jgi:3D (Asp-Asp-Asp) domain-containing protein
MPHSRPLVLVLLALTAGCCRIRPPRDVQPVARELIVTGYCKCGICCGWRRTWYGKPVHNYGPLKGQRKQVGITASGTKARVGTIAADTARYPFGTVMYVPGYGYGVVEDRGSAIRGDHIDLYFNSHREAKEWGVRRTPVKIWRGAK